MKIYAFIPARAGSKGIPLKNIKTLCGKPLVQWSIDTANASKYVDKVFVGTESEIIANRCKDANIFWRSEESSTDTSSSEEVLIEFASSINPEDLVIFIQATSPLIMTCEIDEGISKILKRECDSTLSVVREKRFYWSEDGIPDYNLKTRPRRQNHKGNLVENGGFYISKAKDIIKSECRVSGNIGMIECSPITYYEIDEPDDWLIVESIMKHTLKTLT